MKVSDRAATAPNPSTLTINGVPVDCSNPRIKGTTTADLKSAAQPKSLAKMASSSRDEHITLYIVLSSLSCANRGRPVAIAVQLAGFSSRRSRSCPPIPEGLSTSPYGPPLPRKSRRPLPQEDPARQPVFVRPLPVRVVRELAESQPWLKRIVPRRGLNEVADSNGLLRLFGSSVRIGDDPLGGAADVSQNPVSGGLERPSSAVRWRALTCFASQGWRTVGVPGRQDFRVRHRRS